MTDPKPLSEMELDELEKACDDYGLLLYMLKSDALQEIIKRLISMARK